MKPTNQKPTGKGGLKANQFKTISKRIIVWLGLNGYLSLGMTDWLIQRAGLSHE